MRNARFWVFENGGWVKLTLREGDYLCWHWAARHEEGWSGAEHCWYIAGDRVIEEWSTDGRDCDGRLGSSGVRSCGLDRLAAVFVDDYGRQAPELDEKGEPIQRPAWQSGRTLITDHAAQAAGY